MLIICLNIIQRSLIFNKMSHWWDFLPKHLRVYAFIYTLFLYFMNKPGNTKLIRLSNLEKEYALDVCLFAKLENSNPSGSIKDRAVYQMLIDLKEAGKLNENTIIIEATSGNTGIALAYFGKFFGYKTIIYMPSSMSKERREKISSLGAELVLVDGGMLLCEKLASEAVQKTPSAILFDQFNNPSNVKAHYLSTGPEILKECPNVHYIVAGIGTGGTITGIGKFIKEISNTKVIGVEPLESPLLTKGKSSPHLIQGIGPDFVPSILNKVYIDSIVDVSGEKSIETARKIRNIENLDVGISSGAALLGAIEFIKNNNLKNKNIVVIFPDKGDRYTW